jgi:hypothetical protein
MPDSLPNDKHIQFDTLTNQQRHDIKAALLSIKWSAELLKPPDGSNPPCELISDQLTHAFEILRPLVEQILTAKGTGSE